MIYVSELLQSSMKIGSLISVWREIENGNSFSALPKIASMSCQSVTIPENQKIDGFKGVVAASRGVNGTFHIKGMMLCLLLYLKVVLELQKNTPNSSSGERERMRSSFSS